MNVQTILATDGIVEFLPLLPDQLLDRINREVDPWFRDRADKARSYVRCDELASMGLLEPLLLSLRDVFLTIIPDPTLYHCHLYETAGGSNRAHIYGETLAGWHRDPDSEYHRDHASHVSIFIHMSNVGPQDGAFEFCPGSPEKWLTSATPIISMTGPKNRSFAWNRTFLHRASPNSGPTRRRMLKISIQPSGSYNQHHDLADFVNARAIVSAGDPFLDMVLGRDQERLHHMNPNTAMEGTALKATGVLGVPNATILETMARRKLAQALKKVWRGNDAVTAQSQYD